jgi:hypothetical protein
VEASSQVDLVRATKEAVAESEARAARHDVRITIQTPASLSSPTRPRALSLLLRALIDHAISATPRGGEVIVTLEADNGGAKLTATDGGPVVPAAAEIDLLEHRIDPTALGRPPGFALLVAHTVGSYLGGSVRLGQSAAGSAHTQVRLRAL